MLVVWLLLSAAEPASEPVFVDELVMPPAPARDPGVLVAPFSAWIANAAAHVRLHPQATAADIGIVRGGDMVVVKSCTPNCDAEHGWAELDPFGFVPLSVLRTSAIDPAKLRQATFARFQYGSVQVKSLELHAAPSDDAPVVARVKKGYVLAFVDDAQAAPAGWLLRPSGSYAHARDVKLAHASEFSGVHDPEGPLAFAAHALTLPSGQSVARHAPFAVLGVHGDRVLVEGGSVPKSAVHLAFHRHRPPQIPPGAGWVHVDLKQQVLTAYEGDHWIFATLISSGRKKKPTLPGVFRVQQKVAHTAMSRGKYYVDEVPFILYFDRSQAFHGAFWHDDFGAPISHGCVNLSIADAAWLFNWSKPSLPPGWQSLTPYNANLDSTWVQVEKSPPLGSFAAPMDLTAEAAPDAATK